MGCNLEQDSSKYICLETSFPFYNTVNLGKPLAYGSTISLLSKSVSLSHFHVGSPSTSVWPSPPSLGGFSPPPCGYFPPSTCGSSLPTVIVSNLLISWKSLNLTPKTQLHTNHLPSHIFPINLLFSLLASVRHHRWMNSTIWSTQSSAFSFELFLLVDARRFSPKWLVLNVHNCGITWWLSVNCSCRGVPLWGESQAYKGNSKIGVIWTGAVSSLYDLYFLIAV